MHDFIGHYRRLLPLLGWGLITAWGLVGMSASANADALASNNLVGIFTGGTGIACLMLAIALSRREGSARASGAEPAGGRAATRAWAGRGPCVAGALMSCCCAATYVARCDYPAPWFQLAMQACSSAGYVFVTLGWVRAYRLLDAEDVETLSVLSTAACALVYLVALLAPPLVTSLIWVLLPAASALCLHAGLGALAAEATAAKLRQGEEPPLAPVQSAGMQGRPARRGLRRRAFCLLGVLVGSVALAVPIGLAPSSVLAAPADPYAQLSGLVLSAVLVLYCTVYARRISLAQFFRVLYPLTVCGLCLLAVAPWPALRLAGLCLLYAAQWVLYLFVWLYALESAPGAELATYALLRVGFEAGFLAANALGVFAATPPPSPVGLCFGCAALFVLTILLPLDEQPAPDDAPADGEETAKPDGLLLARLYGLSPRESEILAYLRRGYSLVAIRNELYISKGTVDTYIQRIYRKVGVHARQDLISACEEAERPGRPDVPAPS